MMDSMGIRLPESRRLRALQASGLLHHRSGGAFDAEITLVRKTLGVPVAIVSLVEDERQVFAGQQGLPEPWATLGETPLTHSFCQHVVAQEAPFVVPDAFDEPLVEGNLAITELSVRAYLGVPLALPTGEVVGALAAIASSPREWSAHDLALLEAIAGVVGKNIRAGMAERKWRGIFAEMQEGFILGEVIRDASGKAVDWRYEEVNRAWGELVGIPSERAAGRTIRELFPGIEDEWVSEFADVVETQQPISFTRQVGDLQRWYDGFVQPAGGDRFIVLFLEATSRELEQRRREALRELTDTLLDAQDPDGMSNVAAAIVGRALGVGRVGYGTVGENGETFTVPTDWTKDGFPSLAGVYRMDDYGNYAEDLRQGRTVVIPDIRLDPRTAGDTAPLESVAVRSLINHPIIESGRIVAVLYVNDDQPREWTKDEVEFVQDAAGRTRAAVERRRGEISLRESNERQRLAVDAGEVGVWELDLVSGTLTLDARMRAMNGVSGGELDAAGAFSAVHPDDRARLDENLRKLASGELGSLSIQYRVIGIEDGIVRTVHVHGTASRASDGSVTRLIGAARDITDRVAAEEQQALLNQELSHRMKNTLALVQAIATQTLRAVPDKDPVRALERRLHALSSAHDILLNKEAGGTTMTVVIGGALAGLGQADRVRLSGPPVRLGSRSALSLALLIHELTTNALKYGSLSVADGDVSIAWEVNDDVLALRWQEHGGPPVMEPTHKGLGSRLIGAGLVGTGDTELGYGGSGFSATMRASLEQLGS